MRAARARIMMETDTSGEVGLRGVGRPQGSGYVHSNGGGVAGEDDLPKPSRVVSGLAPCVSCVPSGQPLGLTHAESVFIAYANCGHAGVGGRALLTALHPIALRRT